MDTGPLDYLYLVALIASVVVTTVSATRTLLGSKAKGIHKSISRDTELLPTLTEKAQSELAQDLEIRSYRMLAAIKYPFMRTHEVLALAVAAAFILSLGAMLIELRTRQVVGPAPDAFLWVIGQFLAASFAVATFARVWKAVMDRAADLVEYLYKRVGDEEAAERSQILAFQVFGGAALFGLPLWVLVLWNTAILADTSEWGNWAYAGGIPALVFHALLTLPILSHRFTDITGFYGWVFSQGTHSGWRPKGLGQTQEDIDRFREEMSGDRELTTKPTKKRWRSRASKGA